MCASGVIFNTKLMNVEEKWILWRH